MPCTHDTFESAATVTAREEVRPEGTVTSYLVTLQVRCAACQAQLVFDLPPFHPQLYQVAAQAQGGTEVRLLASLPPTDAEAVPTTWTATPTQHLAPPPLPVTPIPD